MGRHVAELHEVEQHLQLGPVVAPRAAGLLGTDYLTARCLENGAPNAELLIEGADQGLRMKFS